MTHCSYALIRYFLNLHIVKFQFIKEYSIAKKLNGVTKMKSNELESQIKSVKKTKVLLYLILALVVALILIVFVV